MGKTVAELLTGKPQPLSNYELFLWSQYRQKFGFSTDRIEGCVANGASAMCNAWGSNVTNQDILPRFGKRGGDSIKKTMAYLASMPGPPIEFIPFDTTQPRLYGVEALAKLTDTEDEEDDTPRRRRTLDDGGPSPKVNRRNTLGGD